MLEETTAQNPSTTAPVVEEETKLVGKKVLSETNQHTTHNSTIKTDGNKNRIYPIYPNQKEVIILNEDVNAI